MDNLTHALVGVALAECALPRPAAAATRRVFMAAGVVAASAPDIDLAYTWIAEAPLGYLLHHRGHSHTLPGLVVLAAIIIGACRFWPAARAALLASPVRLGLLVASGLLSHLLLDAANSYGTLLLYPFSTRWHYGDAVFVLEPSLWVLLGVTAALNAQRAWSRLLIPAVTAMLVVALGVSGLVTPATVAGLVLTGALLLMAMRTRPAPARAAVALVTTACVFVGMAGLSRGAKAATRDALRGLHADPVVDIVANPGPAAPWCWTVLTVEHADREDVAVVRRGTLSLLPAVVPASRCVAHRVMAGAEPSASAEGTRTGAAVQGPDGPSRAMSEDAVVWNRAWTVDLQELRGLAASHCHVGPWLRFGRVPYVADGAIVDLRFDNPLRYNFSAMALDNPSRGGCPSMLPAWTPPRIDLLSD